MKTTTVLYVVGTLGIAGMAAGVAIERTDRPPVQQAAVAVAAPQAGGTAIVHVRVFDGERVLPSATVVFQGDHIVSVGDDVPPPAGTFVVDGSGKTLLPGLIDAHTHAADRTALERAVVFGVTTELDMFTDPGFAKDVRAEQASHSVTARADLWSAGVLVTAPGGHGTEFGISIPTLAVTGDAQAFVDARIAEGSDYIKVVSDDGTSYGVKWPTLSDAQMRAVVAAAHWRQKMVVVHVGSQREAAAAIEAGADGLAHLFADSDPSAAFAAQVKAHRAFVVPTLTVLESETGRASGATLSTDLRLAPFLVKPEIGSLTSSFQLPRRLPSLTLDHARAAVRALLAAGVPLLAGTDAPNPGTAHGASVHRELELLVSAGLTPLDALIAATSAPARAFGLLDRGRIAPGLRADLVLVSGEPDRDILATRAIVRVWRNGAAIAR